MSYVIQMIAEGEHQKQDFKMRVEDAGKIARTLCAFANTEGGRLLIGVKDNGSIAGVRADEEYHMIQSAAEMHCKPPIAFDVQIWKAELKTVMEVQVPRSAARPHFCADEKGKLQAYLRKEDRIHRASPVLVKVWQYEMRLDRAEFRYDQFIGKLFSAWRSGRALSFLHVVRIGRLDFDATEDLLCLLIVWGIVRWEYGPNGWVYSLNDEDALDQLESSGVEAFRWKDHR